MAFIIKAFGVLPNITDNTINTIATVGELSTHSRTFAYDKLLYADDRFPSNEIVVFSSKSNGNQVNPNEPTIDKAQDIIEKIYNDYDGSTSLLPWLTAIYTDISNVTAGAVVVQDGKNLPRWFEFDYTDDGTPVTMRVWLSDETFQDEYDEFEIIVIPPVEPVTALYQPHTQASAANATATVNSYLTRAETVRDERPFTAQRSYTLRWHDPADNNLTFNTEWLILGYGKQATREDNMLEAIRKYLTDNSSNTIPEWRRYLPEILAEDTIYVLPVWDRVSVTAGPNSDTLYSSIVNYKKLMEIANAVQPSRTDDEIEDYLESGAALYKSIGLVFLGSGKNSAGSRRFTDKYPKYSVVNLNDQSINSLPDTTVTLMREIELLLTQADIDTGSNSLPSAVSRVIEGNFTFLRKTIDGIIYRVVTRISYKANI